MSSNVISPTHAKIMQRFNIMLETVSIPKDILERPHIDIICHGFKGQIPDTEIFTLMNYMRASFQKIGANVKPKEIETKLKHALIDDEHNPWQGRTYIGERDGQIFIQPKIKKDAEPVYISNFMLEPKYTIKVDKGHKYHVYEVTVKDDFVKYNLMLRSSDFNTIADLQKRIEEQLSHTSANINGCAMYMKDIFHKYVTTADFAIEKEGTSLIGLEVINNKKYFCTPDNIFDVEGNSSSELVYMGNAEANLEEIRKLENLNFNKEQWVKHIAPTILRNIIHTHDKIAMLALLGWIGAIPHDYVVRKEAGTGFFPHAHLIGEPGSGKSTILTLVKQFMGHNDSSPRTFSSQFELQKILNSSYTIPAILDEYGKRWSAFKTDSINLTLVEAFTKAGYSKGKADQSSIYYKYKNPLLMAGQIPTSDQALATRIIPIYLYKSFHKSKQGKSSFKHLVEMQKMKDKNFWVGYNLWCAQFSNEEVLNIYTSFRKRAHTSISDSRTADIYAVVMLGLHFMLVLAQELGISEEELGYNATDIDSVLTHLSAMAEVTSNDGQTPLDEFLEEVASFGMRHGNGSFSGNIFGTGLTIMPIKPMSDGSGEYGNKVKHSACIYGRELILIKVEDMVKVLNERSKNDKFNAKELMTFIESNFKSSLEDPHLDSNLVLAPKQYKTQYGRYTAFNKKELAERHEEFNNISWSNHIK